MDVLDYGVIALYGLLVIYIGWRSARRTHAPEDLFLASRGLGISTSQAGRARDAIIRERLDAIEGPRLAAKPKPAPKPKAAHRWHDGLSLRWWPVPQGKRRVRLIVTADNDFDFAEVGS